ncbi:MAG: hypothetical protein R3A44_37130 [Caldilineaceae bacterium]
MARRSSPARRPHGEGVGATAGAVWPRWQGMGIGLGRGGDAGWGADHLRPDDGTVKVWSGSGRRVATLAGHGASVLGVAVTPDGAQIISGSGRPHGEGVGAGQRALCGHAGRAWG